MTDKKCPKCGLWNSTNALRCDCGYDFSSGEMKETFLPDRRWISDKPILPNTKTAKRVFKKRFLFLLGILIPVISTFIGGYMGLWIGTRGVQSTKGWQTLGTPLNKPSQLLGFCEKTICIATKDDQWYRYNPINCSPNETHKCWQEVTTREIEPIIPRLYNPCLYEFTIPSPPNDTIQMIGAKDCGSGGDWYEFYALREDGSVWKWEQSVADIAVLGPLSLAIVGILIGFLSGVIIVIILIWKWLHTSKVEVGEIKSGPTSG